jgi:hypothetical protein
MRRILALALCLFLGNMTAYPQAANEKIAGFKGDLDDAKKAAANTPERRTAVNHLVNLLSHPARFTRYAYGDALFGGLANAWQNSRVDKQVGSTASSSGTTDLVSRPSTPQLLGLAMQLGALTQTVSGTTATFHGNADSMVRAVAGAPISCLGCTGTKGWKNLNFSVSFDLSRQGGKQVSTSGQATATSPTPATIVLPQNSRQLSSFTARYDIYNPKDTRSPEFQQAWGNWFTAHAADLKIAGDKLLDTVSKFLDPLEKDTAFHDMQGDYTQKLVAAASPQDLDKIFAEYLAKALAMAQAKDPDFDQRVLDVRAAYAQYGQVYEDAFVELRGKPQFSVEYTLNRPVDQPDTHNLRFIFAANPFRGNGLFTANVAGTFYNEVPAGAKYGRMRDFQAAGQIDRPLGIIANYPAVFTVAGYVQYQLDPSVINITPGLLVPGTSITLPKDAQVLLGPKGTLGIAQAKVTLNMGNSGLKIPIGVSWASRTELLDATDVRGHVGITYDLDTLFNFAKGR